MLASVLRKPRFPALAAAALYFSATIATPALAARNAAPTISGTPARSVVVETTYRFRSRGADANGDTLRYSIRNKPAWATFARSTGVLSGTPHVVGTYPGIEISVSDGKSSVALPPFSIKVTSRNRKPTITGTPARRVNVGQSFSFTPRASDPESKRLTFSIAGKPSWASFSTRTGTLHGTPAPRAAGNFSGVVISVSDGDSTVSLPAFGITVLARNRAPVISGAPMASAAAGSPYSFRPAASDADGNPLTFSIANKPSWATFDTSTGTLYGTPAASDAGNYANVTISASDGRDQATLAPFTVAVTLPVTRTAELAWTPPTQYVDGSPMSDLVGYRISYGNAPADYTTTVNVTGATVTSIVIEGLAAGQWYFAIRAVTSTGAVSDFSNEVSTTL
jgi:hypothetical protein